MSHPIVIEPTADGVPTLYRPDLDEHYHSTKGALTEARHVYIDMALRARRKSEINLLEVGFGTGLNAWLTLLEAQQTGWHIRYTAFELYPLAPELAAQLDYPDRIDPSMAPTFARLHRCEWERPVEITPNFTLLKRHADLTCTPVEGLYDVVYFDSIVECRNWIKSKGFRNENPPEAMPAVPSCSTECEPFGIPDRRCA